MFIFIRIISHFLFSIKTKKKVQKRLWVLERQKNSPFIEYCVFNEKYTQRLPEEVSHWGWSLSVLENPGRSESRGVVLECSEPGFIPCPLSAFLQDGAGGRKSQPHPRVSMSITPPLCTHELIGPSLVRFGTAVEPVVTDAMTFSRLWQTVHFPEIFTYGKMKGLIYSTS